ncbi:hypothetical protein [Caminibacter pacificus]
MESKINLFLEEGELHKKRLLRALDRLPEHFTKDDIEDENFMDILDTLAFRFSRLQGLLGEKLFKEYLILTLRDVEGKSFVEMLRMLEKEGLVNIEEWQSFRKIRNFIFHDYPLGDSEKIEAINFLIASTPKLITIFDNLKDKVEIITKRD